MRMIRRLCGVSLKERHSSTELKRRLGVEANGDAMRRGKLGWHGHEERKDDADYVKACCTRLVVEGRHLSAVRGRPGRTFCLLTCMC